MYELYEGKTIKIVRKKISYKRLMWIHLATMHLPHEIGGQIKLDRQNKILGFDVYSAGPLVNEVILPDSQVIEFHTHPRRDLLAFPSVTDLMAQAKRSFNSFNSGKSKKWSQYRGPIAIVFNRIGAVTYSYKRCKLPSRKEQKDMLDGIVQLSAPAGQTDTIVNLEAQAKFIRPFGFYICVFSWGRIKLKGLPLKFRTRRYHVPSTFILNSMKRMSKMRSKSKSQKKSRSRRIRAK